MYRFEIWAIGAQGNGLMFVKDFDAAGTKIIESDKIRPVLDFVRKATSAWYYTDDCEWKCRAIKRFIVAETNASGTVLGWSYFDGEGNETFKDGTRR
jgi:hypothetical protein